MIHMIAGRSLPNKYKKILNKGLYSAFYTNNKKYQTRNTFNYISHYNRTFIKIMSNNNGNFTTGGTSVITSQEMKDKTMLDLLDKEWARQTQGIELIASENFTSAGVMKALGSCLTNKYSEGLPGKRYYGGNQFIDQIERLCISRAKEAYRLLDREQEWHVNCQSLSGTPANFQVMTALLKPGDVIMGLDLPSGGHLSHGYQISVKNKETGKLGTKKLTAPAIYFDSHSYQTNPETGLLDYNLIMAEAQKWKPKLLICGGSAYPRDWDYSRFREIADSVGAYLLCDMAHISGLVLAKGYTEGGVNDPFEFCDIVTTTTHKTMRGPRGALIFCRAEFGQIIDQAVFPGCQGGPHNNAMAGIATALWEAMTPEFERYIDQVMLNARVLGLELEKKGYKLVTGGTSNHLILWDLRDLGLSGSKMEKICDFCEVTLNKNTVPGDKSALSPGGVRIGTPAMTSRGFKEVDMVKLADLLDRLIKKAKEIQEQANSKKLNDFVVVMEKDQDGALAKIRREVNEWASGYYMPGI
jgi:glycine hydroxymethyltransferase